MIEKSCWPIASFVSAKLHPHAILINQATMKMEHIQIRIHIWDRTKKGE
jgi:hypothetical protein